MELKAFLGSSYKSQKFESFLTEHFHGFSVSDSVYDDEHLSESEKEHIKDYRYLGQVELDDGKEIGFFEFRSTTSHIENKRVGYNTTLRKLAKDHILDGAIASFYYPDSDEKDVWRLSFVGIDYDAGKANVTNLKRYTYVLGKDVPIQTPLEQLKDFKYPTMDEIEKAFSVERVSKEFFEKYKNLYLELSNYLQSQMAHFGNEKNLNLFSKKLLGRVVFLYFIQKKGWFGSAGAWGTGNKKFLSDCFFEKCNYDNFYFEILQPIFFKALNEKRKDDHFALLDCKMPFLNGGLFSEDEFDKRDIVIDNGIFEAIFTTFDQYNFTIIEDNPNDSEIAIDPEMLGRVFESLLEDRKEKGAFYTPREIVHYMSRNAIEHYLKTEAKDYNYVFSVDEFLHKTSLSDDEILQFHTDHPVKFIKIDNYFEALHPYNNLIVDFYMVVKLRGLLLNKDGIRSKGKKGHPEVTVSIWQKILKKEYEVVAINFGSNKEIKLSKNYKYPTILKYIQIEEKFFAMAFLPNIWGDLELNTIFPIREKNIQSRLRKFDKPLHEINKDNFVFDNEAYMKVEALREDCRSLHAEPLHQGAELPRQAVVQKGLSTFRKAFTLDSLADNDLKGLLKDKDYYQKTINKLLNASTLTQHKLKDIMLKKLKQIKVLDPAIGSGAFPMGVLHELVDLRRHLGDTTDLATLKKEIIENSIYGIDIEPSAVEIAKLRFWLSIVVDEDTPTPLPNLFYKIMVGNSLIETVNGLFDPLEKQDTHLFDDSYQISTLQDKFHAYYKAWDNDKKTIIQNEINVIIDEVLDAKLLVYEDELDSQLRNRSLFKLNEKKIDQNIETIALIKNIKKRPTTEIFFYKLYFAEVMNGGGFNVIIGNPPYVGEKGHKDIFRPLKKEFKDRYEKNSDLFYFFFLKSIDLLKNNGILAFITTNYFLTADGAVKLRREFKDRVAISDIVNFNEMKLFKSALGQHNIITTLQKTKNIIDTNIVNVLTPQEHFDNEFFTDSKEVEVFTKKSNELYEGDKNHIRVSKQGEGFENVFRKMTSNSKTIESVCFVNTGFNTGADRVTKSNLRQAYKNIPLDIKIKDGIFVLNKNEYSSINPESKLTYKCYKNSDINKYFSNKWQKIYVVWTTKNINIDTYPNIKNHLNKYRNFLELKREYKTGQLPWYSQHWAREYDVFGNKDKIVFPYRAKSNIFSYSDGEYFGSKDILYLRQKDAKFSIKYLLALLNSKLYYIWFYYKGKCKGETLELYVTPMGQVPIKDVPKKEQQPFISLVNQIITLKKQNKETQHLEDKLDIMVYALYGLSEEEIAIVEGSRK